MYRYLTDKTADYVTTTLTVTPTVVLPQTGDKTQIVHTFDDGTVTVVGIASTNFFTIVLQWKYVPDVDHTALMDFWHNEAKGAGRRRTFYWEHPIDNKTYTVRFMSPFTTAYSSVGNLSIGTTTLRVEGNKPYEYIVAL
jgi:hypothetical protein